MDSIEGSSQPAVPVRVHKEQPPISRIKRAETGTAEGVSGEEKDPGGAPLDESENQRAQDREQRHDLESVES